jgi:hypothetical protein
VCTPAVSPLRAFCRSFHTRTPIVPFTLFVSQIYSFHRQGGPAARLEDRAYLTPLESRAPEWPASCYLPTASDHHAYLLRLETAGLAILPSLVPRSSSGSLYRKFKGTVSRDFLLLDFFMNQFPPSPRVLHLDRFEFFRKFAEIFGSQGAPPVSTAPVANFPPVSTTPAAKLPSVSTTPVANLPPVSATPVANFSTIFASVVDTGGKFATGVNDTGDKFATGVDNAGGKLPSVSTTPAANLPPVSLTPVAYNGNNIRLQTP